MELWPVKSFGLFLRTHNVIHIYAASLPQLHVQDSTALSSSTDPSCWVRTHLCPLFFDPDLLLVGHCHSYLILFSVYEPSDLFSPPPPFPPQPLYPPSGSCRYFWAGGGGWQWNLRSGVQGQFFHDAFISIVIPFQFMFFTCKQTKTNEQTLWHWQI